MSLCYYFSTENIEEIILKLRNEKDGKRVGEVVVGVSGLRLGQTSGIAIGNFLNKSRPQSNVIPPGMMLPPGSYIREIRVACNVW